MTFTYDCRRKDGQDEVKRKGSLRSHTYTPLGDVNSQNSANTSGYQKSN